ncbi:hypothetical protein POPTR_008G099950v4 [Populus trichocarpa]|uniref:Uncharacterized protein n=4 Tax=Populus trichocarpa TaxID=3694 RepID=A0ACC0SKT8_POPTR|nr:hypothetical protein BDE02_08G088600 [Populus trichocarpa]KAI5579425.1 hypothetical protein BDE02_08G088600 [Populus trichocarpa]KAI5579426.1 hypothetical protein BDE02_08G088600 [Populus trichocarpa]KAI5579427.1 hypothetical protein BDE02_08G088600 [Populus trichocarpa]KAI5579428.1 hypothetical protein BDE02_08G088600 [Populus trichocarpa]
MKWRKMRKTERLKKMMKTMTRIPRGMNLKKPKRTFWKGMQEQPLPWKMVRLVEDQEHEVELGKSDYTLFSRKCNNYLQRSMK